MMRPVACLSISLLLAVPVAASANCYSVYSGQNQLVYQSTTSPIDLSKRISDVVSARFPGGFMVMNPDESACNELRASGGSVRPRFEDVGLAPGSGGASDRTLLASPLLRDSRTAAPYSSGDGGSATTATTTTTTTRSGTNLNMRGAAAGTRR